MRAPYPKKTTRDDLLKRVRDGLKPNGSVHVEAVVDLVLAETDTFVRPFLENDWTGGEVLHQLRIWRKGRL